MPLVANYGVECAEVFGGMAVQCSRAHLRNGFFLACRPYVCWSFVPSIGRLQRCTGTGGSPRSRASPDTWAAKASSAQAIFSRVSRSRVQIKTSLAAFMARPDGCLCGWVLISKSLRVLGFRGGGDFHGYSQGYRRPQSCWDGRCLWTFRLGIFRVGYG